MVSDDGSAGPETVESVGFWIVKRDKTSGDVVGLEWLDPARVQIAAEVGKPLYFVIDGKDAYICDGAKPTLADPLAGTVKAAEAELRDLSSTRLRGAGGPQQTST